VEFVGQGLDLLYLTADRLVGGRLTLLLRTAIAFDQDDSAIMSRSIAFYALFSLFPLLLLLMTFASSVLASEEAQVIVLEAVDNIMPFARDLVEENIAQVLESRNTIGILAGIGLLWSASGVFTALYRAVNRAWGNPKSELFWTEKLYGLAVVTIAGLFLVATTLYSTFVSIVRSWQLSFLGWQPFADPAGGRLVGWLSALVPALISIAIFITLYRTMPRNKVRWRDVWLGGLIAGLLWEICRQLYAWYLANFARYSLVYGSVGVIIGFLLWAYLSAMIVLLGAEFTAQHTQWRKAGRPVESRPPREWIEEWSE
jgi:membrane protein